LLSTSLFLNLRCPEFAFLCQRPLPDGDALLFALQSMTTDGPGGAFYGYLAGIGMDSVTGRQVLLVPILDMLRQTALVPRLIVLVISGPAAGQWRRIVSVVSNRAPVTVAGILYPAGGIRYAALDSPFGQPFDIGSSAVTIGIMKGRFILEGVYSDPLANAAEG
jgi:hypothetical protein